jgi:hypothetical protein
VVLGAVVQIPLQLVALLLHLPGGTQAGVGELRGFATGQRTRILGGQLGLNAGEQQADHGEQFGPPA